MYVTVEKYVHCPTKIVQCITLLKMMFNMNM